MTVKELKAKLEKLDDNLPVIIEGENGMKYSLLTAKKRIWQVRSMGRAFVPYCWLPVKEKLNNPGEI